MDARQALLREVFARHSGPFAYGGADCASFARDVVETLNGRRLALPEWTDEVSAQTVIRRHGSLRAAVVAVLGEPTCLSPEDGDVVLVRTPTGTELCAVWANGRPVARGGRGVVPLPARWAVDCWRTT